MTHTEVQARIRRESEALLHDAKAVQVITLVLYEENMIGETSGLLSRQDTITITEAAAEGVLSVLRPIIKRQQN